MSNLEKLAKRIMEGDYKWVNINGNSYGDDDLDFMLRPENICFENTNTLLIETCQLTYRIHLPEIIVYDEDWDTFDFSSKGFDYFIKFM